MSKRDDVKVVTPVQEFVYPNCRFSVQDNGGLVIHSRDECVKEWEGYHPPGTYGPVLRLAADA